MNRLKDNNSSHISLLYSKKIRSFISTLCKCRNRNLSFLVVLLLLISHCISVSLLSNVVDISRPLSQSFNVKNEIYTCTQMRLAGGKKRAVQNWYTRISDDDKRECEQAQKGRPHTRLQVSKFMQFSALSLSLSVLFPARLLSICLSLS